MSLARLLPPLRASRPCIQRFTVARRSISHSPIVRAGEDGADDALGLDSDRDFEAATEANAGDEAPVGGGKTGRGPFRGIRQWNDTPYHLWITGDGSTYRDVPAEGRHYLGGDGCPFPLNPSFKPPIPTSDNTRTLIYKQYIQDGKTVRELSFEHGISLRRVEAILRLKHLEVQWRHNQRLETSFQQEMEQALGVTYAARTQGAKAAQRAAVQGGETAGEDDRYTDAALADFLHDIANPDAPAPGHVKMYFEPVDENTKPFLDPLLQKLRQNRLAKEAQSSSRSAKAEKLVPRGDGDVHYQFVDVGNAFVNERDLKAREKRAERQRSMKGKKKELRRAALRLDGRRLTRLAGTPRGIQRVGKLGPSK
ncbi:hypothetical protein AURDEDRAFT_159066 [Auricularia subglabra TFB-10046 SS5]|nr:hypothetical protein AURDEDRAFT_159066 [Auricularia subglabra TFB-10046 SS5]